MIGAIVDPAFTHNVTSRLDTGQERRLNESSGIYVVRPRNPYKYAGLWKVIASRNASVDLSNDLLELHNLDGAITGGWFMPLQFSLIFSVPANLRISGVSPIPRLRRVSLAQARRLAIEALVDAEKRRQSERKQEATFWSAVDDET